MAELTENLIYKECNYLYQLYIGNPLHRLINPLKTTQHVTVSKGSTVKRRAFKSFKKTNDNVLLKFKGIYTTLSQGLYNIDKKTFLWVLFSNVSNFIIINGLVN